MALLLYTTAESHFGTRLFCSSFLQNTVDGIGLKVPKSSPIYRTFHLLLLEYVVVRLESVRLLQVQLCDLGTFFPHFQTLNMAQLYVVVVMVNIRRKTLDVRH